MRDTTPGIATPPRVSTVGLDDNSPDEDEVQLRGSPSRPITAILTEQLAQARAQRLQLNRDVNLDLNQDFSGVVKIDDEDIEVIDSEESSFIKSDGVLYHKEERDNLTPEKRNELFLNAVKCQHPSTKYDFTSTDLTDEKRLDDLYNISIMIAKTKASHMQYDLHSVFSIVVPDKPGSRELAKPDTVDLYTCYDDVTEDQVAESCEWYRLWTKRSYYRDNLTLTFKQLENSMTPKLFDKCFEQYESYPEVQRGGPLLFIIMMKLLVSHSEDAVTHLKVMIKKLKISDFQGENVSRVVSLLRGTYKHLRFIKKVPEDFNNQVLKILQTSSVPKFNDYFAHHQKTMRMAKDVAVLKRLDYDPDDHASIDILFRLAETEYKSLVASGEWLSSTSKGKSSAFSGETKSSNSNTSSNNNLTCWNCGKKGHSLSQCSEPRNDTRIAINRERFMKERKNKEGSANTSDSGNSKYKPPTPEEKNRRIIDGKHMFYLTQVKRWVLDRSHHSNKPKDGTATTASATTTEDKSDNKKSSNSTVANAAIANTTQSLETALRGLVNQFTD